MCFLARSPTIPDPGILFIIYSWKKICNLPSIQKNTSCVIVLFRCLQISKHENFLVRLVPFFQNSLIRDHKRPRGKRRNEGALRFLLSLSQMAKFIPEAHLLVSMLVRILKWKTSYFLTHNICGMVKTASDHVSPVLCNDKPYASYMSSFECDDGWVLEWSLEFSSFMSESCWYQITVDSLLGTLFTS